MKNPTTWQEDAAQAKQLFGAVKELAAAIPKKDDDGYTMFDGAEAQVKANRMMAEARELMESAAAKKAAPQDSAKLGALMEQFERDLAAVDPETSGGSKLLADMRSTAAAPIVGTESGRRYPAGLSPVDRLKPRIEVAASERIFRDFRSILPAEERARAQAVERDTAALVEGGAGTNGGYLVVPEYLQEMFAEVRRQGNALRALGWLNEHRTGQTNLVLIPKAAGATIVGLVAELAVKPTADNNYSQISVPIFTMAGISSTSRQLMKDADPAVADILARDMATLLGNLEEQLIISGTGTGQPRGILNTVGTAATPAVTTSTGQTVIDAIIDTIAGIATTYFAPPTGILMRPFRIAFLQKTKDTSNNYVLNAAGTFRAPAPSNALSVTSQTEDTVQRVFELLGMPIAGSTNVPQNLGAGTNQDCIIVANWREAHWFQREDQTLDASDVASDGAGNSAFVTNRVLYRLEERAGFTAERYPGAFGVITGTGMVSPG